MSTKLYSIEKAKLETLAEIHNRLAEISRYLGIAVTKYAKIDVKDKESDEWVDLLNSIEVSNKYYTEHDNKTIRHDCEDNECVYEFYSGDENVLGYKDEYKGLYTRTKYSNADCDYVFGDRNRYLSYDEKTDLIKEFPKNDEG